MRGVPAANSSETVKNSKPLALRASLQAAFVALLAANGPLMPCMRRLGLANR
jgi:hypothetical protein